jgi:glycosyltransferase involved in cell wall biosynthesis
MINMVPLVSVIIPTRNRAEFLKKSILSVLKQTFSNIEIIVVDDGSSDNTSIVVGKLKKKHGNIIYIKKTRSPHNPAATRNDGIRKSRGKFVALLDDDDEWLPQKVELQLNEFKKNGNLGLIFTGYFETDGRKKRILRDMGTSTVMIKRSCLNRVGLFDENLTCAEDRDLYERIYRNCSKKIMKDILVIHRIHSNQISSDLSKKIVSEKYYIKKHFKELKKKNKLFNSYFVLGSLHIKNGDFSDAKKYLRMSLKVKNSFRARAYLMFVYLFPKTLKVFLSELGS